MVDDVGQLISARSWMRRDEKPSPTLQNQLVSYTLNLSFGHTAWNTEIKPVIYQVHLADFTLNVGSPVHRLIGYEGSLLFWIYSIYAARVWCWQLVRYHSRRDGGMGTCVLIYYIYIYECPGRRRVLGILSRGCLHHGSWWWSRPLLF